jgi:hypothetical protein
VISHDDIEHAHLVDDDDDDAFQNEMKTVAMRVCVCINACEESTKHTNGGGCELWRRTGTMAGPGT